MPDDKPKPEDKVDVSGKLGIKVIHGNPKPSLWSRLKGWFTN